MEINRARFCHTRPILKAARLEPWNLQEVATEPQKQVKRRQRQQQQQERMRSPQRSRIHARPGAGKWCGVSKSLLLLLVPGNFLFFLVVPMYFWRSGLQAERVVEKHVFHIDPSEQVMQMALLGRCIPGLASLAGPSQQEIPFSWLQTNKRSRCLRRSRSM